MINVRVAIIIGLVALAAVILIVAIAAGTSKKTSAAAPATNTAKAPDSADTDAAQSAADYEVTIGVDKMWLGKEDATVIEPYTTVETAKARANAMPDVIGFVIYKGRVHYRHSLATTPVTWPAYKTSYGPGIDGTYLKVR